jgi:hypothetical protein
VEDVTEHNHSQKEQQQGAASSSSPSSTLSGPVAAVPTLASHASLDPLACQLFRISLSSDGDALAQLSTRLQACGLTLLSELEGMSVDDVRATVADAKLNPFAAVKHTGRRTENNRPNGASTEKE